MKNNAIIDTTDKVQRVLEIMNLTDSQVKKYMKDLKFTPNVFIVGIEYGRDKKRAVLWGKHNKTYNHGFDNDRERSHYHEYCEMMIADLLSSYFSSIAINKKVPKYERILEIYVNEKGTINEYWRQKEENQVVKKKKESPFVGDSVSQRSTAALFKQLKANPIAVEPLGLGGIDNKIVRFSFPKFNLGDYIKVASRVFKDGRLNEVGYISDIYWLKDAGWLYSYIVEGKINRKIQNGISSTIPEEALTIVNKRNHLGIKTNFTSEYVMFEANEPTFKLKKENDVKGKPQIYRIDDSSDDTLKIIRVMAQNGKLVGYGEFSIVKLPHQFIRYVPENLAEFICGVVVKKPDQKAVASAVIPSKFEFPKFQVGDFVKIKELNLEGKVLDIEWNMEGFFYRIRPKDIVVDDIISRKADCYNIRESSIENINSKKPDLSVKFNIAFLYSQMLVIVEDTQMKSSLLPIVYRIENWKGKDLYLYEVRFRQHGEYDLELVGSTIVDEPIMFKQKDEKLKVIPYNLAVSICKAKFLSQKLNNQLKQLTK